MTQDDAEQTSEILDSVYRSDSRRILATLIRLLGDFDLAEDALHDAFTAALERWPKEGVPANPRAWLVSTGRFKAIDAMRRRVRFDASQAAVSEQLYADRSGGAALDDESLEDDRLRMAGKGTTVPRRRPARPKTWNPPVHPKPQRQVRQHIRRTL